MALNMSHPVLYLTHFQPQCNDSQVSCVKKHVVAVQAQPWPMTWLKIDLWVTPQYSPYLYGTINRERQRRPSVTIGRVWTAQTIRRPEYPLNHSHYHLSWLFINARLIRNYEAGLNTVRPCCVVVLTALPSRSAAKKRTDLGTLLGSPTAMTRLHQPG